MLEKNERSSFPYPVNASGKETPALTWVRNHSSYLTVGGFLNYLQVAGVYVRGILVNLVVLAPLILAGAVIPAWFHHVILNHPFAATSLALLLFAAAITVFLVRGPVELINTVSNRLRGDRIRDGSDSRLGREQLIAWALLALAAGLAIDLTPRLIEFARLNQSYFQLKWSNVSAGIFGLAAVAGSASRFLDRFESKKASYAIGAVGLASLTIPYLMLLGVTNYLVYGIVPTRSMYAWLVFLTLLAFAVAVVISFRVCKADRMPKANKVITCGVAVAFAIAIGILIFAASKTGDRSVIVAEFIGSVARPLSRLTDVDVPSDDPLAESKAYRDFMEKGRLLTSIDQVRFSASGYVSGDSSPFSVLWPGAWLNWMNDRDTDAEHFLAASDILEAGERLHDLDSTDKSRFLRHAGDAAYRTIRDVENKRGNNEEANQADEINAMLLTEILREKFGSFSKNEQENSKFSLAELAESTANDNQMDRDFSAIVERKIPKRLSSSFLSRVGREKEEEKPNDKMAIDIDLSGPRIFLSLDRDLFNAKWREAMWTGRLSRMHSVDIWSETIVNELLSVSQLDGDTAVRVVKDARRQRAASSLTTRQLLQLLDRKDVIHRAIPDSTSAFKMQGIPENLMGSLELIAIVLDRAWSADRAEIVSTELTKLCEELELGSSEDFRVSCFDLLLDRAIRNKSKTDAASLFALAELFNPSVDIELLPMGLDPIVVRRVKAGQQLSSESLGRLATTRFTNPVGAEPALRRLVFSDFGNLQGLDQMNERVFAKAFWSKAMFVLITATLLSALVWLFVDINRTSAHGFYRDRLSRAFLFDVDAMGTVTSAFDVRLSELANYASGSIAPFHLINCAVNLQRSADLEIRAEKSDYFTFNSIYVGSDRTGYLRTEILESVCPTLSVGTAMAVSAGAASPNMGRNTNSLLVFLMTFANLRLGFWLPNPQRVVTDIARNDHTVGQRLLSLNDTRKLEFNSITERRKNLALHNPDVADPMVDIEGSLSGFACSGGGIRSAAINTGIAQALHEAGLFHLFDYLSTVSGGGYFGSSVSASMRTGFKHDAKTSLNNAMTADVAPFQSGIDPWITGYRWITRPTHYFKEMTSWLRDDDTWVNLSDGGHIENLGFYELLRRRCRFIVVGDGEADPKLDFPSLTFAIQTARARLNTTIEWTPESIHLWNKEPKTGDIRRPHHALGRIQYPDDDQPAFVLYLKSSVNGDEPADVRGYARLHDAFPHESTADQFFDPSQFEAYRELGRHIAETALTAVGLPLKRASDETVSFSCVFDCLEKCS